MSKQPSSSDGVPPPAKMPTEMLSVLGRAALLRTESGDAYDALTAHCAAAVDPQDMVEWLMVRDYADLTWEILRLQRMKRHIVNLGTPAAVDRITRQFTTEEIVYEAGADAKRCWNAGGEARKGVCREFARHDVNEETIHTEAFIGRFDDIERVEHLLSEKELLRRVVLRDLELYRDSPLRAHRRIAADIDAAGEPPALAPPARRAAEPGRRAAAGDA